MALTPQIQKVVGAGAEKLTNYDYVDIADGTGVVNFYVGMIYKKDDASGARLSNHQWYSDKVIAGAYAVPTSGSVYLMVNQITPEMTFNTPRVIKGNIIVNVAVGINPVDVTTTYSHIPYARVKKWNGTAETTLAFTSGAKITKAAGAGYLYKTYAINVLVPETNFKAGETLRIGIEQYAKAGDTTADPNNMKCSYLIGTDPMNRATSEDGIWTFGSAPTISQVQVPFKIDV